MCDHSAMTIPSGPQLHPNLTMVRCDDRTLQIGIVPDEAVTVNVPDNYSLDDVMWLLSRCDGSRSLEELVRLFGEGKNKVMDPDDVRCLLQELHAAGVAHLGAQELALPEGSAHKLTVGVAGRGVLLEEIRRLMAAEGARIVEWSRAQRPRVDVVIVSESIIPDPVLIHSLVERQQPFLLCTLVDNRGVVGPLLRPGVSPPQTLRKATVPAVASYLPALVTARLARETGRASHATITATAAFAVSMLRQCCHASSNKVCHEQWMVTPDAGIVSRHVL